MAKRMVGCRVTGGELAPRAYAIYEDVPESMSDDAMATQIDDLTALNQKLTSDLTALALDWQERAEKLSLALAAEQAINKDLKIELDEACADIEKSLSDFRVAGGKLSEAQDGLSKLRAMLETAHGKFCKIAGGEAWTDTCLDGYRKTPGGLREFAESAAKEIDRSIEAGTVRD